MASSRCQLMSDAEFWSKCQLDDNQPDDRWMITSLLKGSQMDNNHWGLLDIIWISVHCLDCEVMSQSAMLTASNYTGKDRRKCSLIENFFLECFRLQAIVCRQEAGAVTAIQYQLNGI